MRTIVFLALFISCPVFAQTRAASSTELDQLYASAKSAIHAAEASFKEETGKSKGFDACKSERLDFEIAYHQWFLDHFEEYKTRDRQVNEATQLAARKMESLKSTQMVPISGQETGKEISLKTITEFLGILNGRLETAPEDQIELIISQMEKPRYNRTGATLDQIKASLEMMTTSLNAELKETNAIYHLEFTRKTRSFNLDLVITLNTGSGAKEHRFSLIGESKISLSESLRLQIISADEKIGEYSANAVNRYFEMYQKLVSPTCADEKILYYDYESEGTLPPTPWTSPAVLTAKASAAPSMMAMSPSVAKKYNIVFTAGTQNVGDITVNGVSLRCNMYPDFKAVEYKGELYLFTVGVDHVAYVHHHNQWLPGPGGVSSIIRIKIDHGIPVAYYRTSNGEAMLRGDGSVSN